MQDLPRISVITPSFNQGRFLEDTILSVLGQNYANLDYIIIDGGSTDHSVEIIKKYEKYLSYWVSEQDNGQAGAINKGFKKSDGEILCWLNSDDLFMPNILHTIAENLNTGEAEIVTGDSIHFSENEAKGTWASGSQTARYFSEMNMHDGDIMIQPSTFWTRKAWEKTGTLNEALHYVFDWEWFLRAIDKGATLKILNRTLSMYRIHDSHKTASGGIKRHHEIINVYNQFGENKNAELYKHLLHDKKILDKRFVSRMRKALSLIKVRPTDAKILKLIYPMHYKNINEQKLINILYFTGE